MNWIAHWIWLAQEHPPTKPTYALARKTFDLGDGYACPRLYITADSRYVVWINGQRVGRGPIRGWPWARYYDTHDLDGLLRPGENTIEVLIVHYGVSNFQYISQPAGLLAQVEWKVDGQIQCLGTDASWQIAEHPAYDVSTPRISCQQSFVEHYDGRAGAPDWQAPLVRQGAAVNPEQALNQRPIPFLAEDPLTPKRVLAAERVRPPQQIWSFDLRPHLLPGNTDANRHTLCGLVATTVHVPQAMTVKFVSQSGVGGQLLVDGVQPKRLPSRDPWGQGQCLQAELSAGEHLLVWNVSGYYHEWHFSWVVDAPVRLTPRWPLGADTPFAVIGPLANAASAKAMALASTGSMLATGNAPVIAISEADLFSDHVLDRISLAQALGPHHDVDGLDNLCVDQGQDTVIHPTCDGSDIQFIVDMGAMTVGFIEFELTAPEGVIADMAGFESIQDGIRDYTLGCGNVMRYVTSAGRQRYQSLQRRGMRYLNVTLRNLTESVQIHWLRVVQNTYPLVERGQFRCDDWALNRIWEIGRHTARLCSEDTYVDCPTYEQVYWVGDARNESLVTATAFGDYDLTRHCLQLAAASLERSDIVESQVPSGWQNLLPAWSLLWVLAVDEYGLWSGDGDTVAQLYPSVWKQAQNIRQYINSNGLFEIAAWNLLDWAPMDTPDEGVVAHQNGWLVRAWRRGADMAEGLEHSEQARQQRQWADDLVAAINAHLWDDTRQAYIDCIHANGARSETISQQTNTVMLLCDCVPDDRREAVERLILDPAKDVIRIGSPFMMFFLLGALQKLGRYELMVELMRDNWRMMIDRGATTCWETFPGWAPGGRYTRSHCHAWSAAPTYFLSTCQLGVTPLEQGFTKALITPQPAGLRWAEGIVPTPRGDIQVRWEDEVERFTVTVSLPADVAGVLRSPKGQRFMSVENREDGQAERMAKGQWRVNLEQGATATVAFARAAIRER